MLTLPSSGCGIQRQSLKGWLAEMGDVLQRRSKLSPRPLHSIVMSRGNNSPFSKASHLQLPWDPAPVYSGLNWLGQHGSALLGLGWQPQAPSTAAEVPEIHQGTSLDQKARCGVGRCCTKTFRAAGRTRRCWRVSKGQLPLRSGTFCC